jgi:5'-phosphate synthase pdxT subunit
MVSPNIMPHPQIGVLALQGDFEAHGQALARCGVRARMVRLPGDLEGLDGLVLPGGESTTMLRLIREFGFSEAIPGFVERGGALYGTCAGAILIAHHVTSPEQWSFGLLDIDIERNGFGRQAESFEAELTQVAPELQNGSPDAPFRAVFIRAPRIQRVGPGVTLLASWKGEPVLVRRGRILVSTFHPELTADTRIHRHFLTAVVGAPDGILIEPESHEPGPPPRALADHRD